MSRIVVCQLLGVFLTMLPVVKIEAASNITLLSSRPDMGESVMITGARLPWKSQFSLAGDQATARRDNRCGFTFSYELVNSGNQSLPITSTSVFADQRQLHLGQRFILRVGDRKTVSGTIYLLNGLSQLQFTAESSQGSSEQTVSVLVSGC